jgi:hypothetical protein
MPIIVIWWDLFCLHSLDKINHRARSPALIDLRQEPRNSMETVFGLAVND